MIERRAALRGLQTGQQLLCAVVLGGCALTPFAGGRFLQAGPRDAPVLETEFDSADTCDMMLHSFDAATQQSSRCVGRLSALPYSYEVRLELIGKVLVHANTLEGCERSRRNALGKDNMRVLSPCKASASSETKQDRK